MTAEHIPADKLATEKTTNTSKATAYTNLQTRLTALNASATALGAENLFSTRKAASTTTNSTWTPAAAAGTAIGSYQIAVSQLATASRRTGTSDIGNALNPVSDDVSGLTLANLPTSTAVSAGAFTVNGQKVTIALTDSLDQVFSAISTATSGVVTASYDHLTDKITLSGGGTLVLGAANDTSNFLSAMKLSNNNSPSVESASKLGSVNKSAMLASARLTAGITAVDGSGNGSFSLNGVSISYNVNTDSLTSVMQRINQSTAGVTAAYDGSNDRVVLSNSVTGDVGIGVSEATGGLMEALGLSSSMTLTRGNNAQFTINGGAVLTSTSNTLSSTAHGIEGLNITVDSAATQTISVSGDTAGMRSSIENFITKYNEVQSFIDEQTKITTLNGKVKTSLLSSDREIQSWASNLRSRVFATIPGLSGTIARLEHLGIDFTSGTSSLVIKNGAKLDTALREKPSDVAAFFQTATTGLSDVMDNYLTLLTTSGTTKQKQLTKSNTDIDKQIETIERRLAAQRAVLESSFIAMESAQSKLKSQGDALNKAFNTSSN